MCKVIVIDDNVVYCDYVCNLLGKANIPTERFYTLAKAKKAVAAIGHGDILLSDLRFPDGSGTDLLELLRKDGKRNPFIVMTDYAEIPSAVQSMKLGAEDYISKRVLEDGLVPMIRRLFKRTEQSRSRQERIHDRNSEAFRKIDHRIRLVAPTDISVLILGENGTGKDHIAQKIHRHSERADRPFVAVDCGVLTPSLAASVLFGHEKGAFTGAVESKTGYFGEADGGTLFLDEVGNLPLEVQQMLLRAIQNKTYRPVGGSKDKTADVRIITATNEDLELAVKEGKFRQDLFYRLREFVISIPPLRDCREDILPLAEFFLNEMNTALKKSVSDFDERAKNVLYSHNWTGNVRELRQVVQTAVLLTGEGLVTADALGLDAVETVSSSEFALVDDRMQRERIIRALREAGGNKRQAARLLEISVPTLYKKLEQYNIEQKTNTK